MKDLTKSKFFFKKYYKYEKVRFLLFGSLNVLATNILLQILLVLTKVHQATFISQVFNLLVGFYLYRNKVFKPNIFIKRSLLNYVILSISSWQINLILILLSNHIFKTSSNISAILAMPLLACWSYTIQKNFVFK